MSRLTDFVGQMTSGFARTNRYTVQMTLPVELNVHPSDQQRVALLCESVTLPSLNVNTVQIRTFGEISEMPTEFNYDPITLTFYVDGDMIVKDVFDKWIKSVQNGSTRTFNYYNNYRIFPREHELLTCPEMMLLEPKERAVVSSYIARNIMETQQIRLDAIQPELKIGRAHV